MNPPPCKPGKEHTWEPLERCSCCGFLRADCRMAKLMALELTEGSVSQMDGDEAFRHLLKVASILEGVK